MAGPVDQAQPGAPGQFGPQQDRAVGPAEALALVEALPLAGYPWWASVRADLLQRLDRNEEAREALRQAIAWTGNDRERVLLSERLERL